MNENENNDEVIVDNVEETNNDEVVENTEEKTEKSEKPKRTPQEELEYFEGRAARLRKKLGTEKPVNNDSKPTPTGKPSELDYGQLALLNSMVGLKGKDEIALAREYISNGKDILGLSENKFFLQDLQTIREMRASADAIPKGKGRSGQTGVTDVDMAFAKYKDSGELPTDFATRNKVIDQITKEEVGDMFTGPSVVK